MHIIPRQFFKTFRWRGKKSGVNSCRVFSEVPLFSEKKKSKLSWKGEEEVFRVELFPAVVWSECCSVPIIWSARQMSGGLFPSCPPALPPPPRPVPPRPAHPEYLPIPRAPAPAAGRRSRFVKLSWRRCPSGAERRYTHEMPSNGAIRVAADTYSHCIPCPSGRRNAD